MAEVWSLAWERDELGLDALVLFRGSHAIRPGDQAFCRPPAASDDFLEKLLDAETTAADGYAMGKKSRKHSPNSKLEIKN